ncbi:MAG: hypothetical protein ABIQ89_04515 [Candidatus Saccharimonadales bacterium]
MAKNKPSDQTLVFIKISRAITYVVYAYTLIASTFLALAFVLQLFGANYSTPFVQFVYKGAHEFLQPFRGIFPGHQVTETSYFNGSALFAIMMYMIIAAALHSLITYITSKMVAHQQELDDAQN